MPFMCTSIAPVKVGMGKGDTDNSVETIGFGKTEISRPFNHNVPERSVAGIYI